MTRARLGVRPARALSEFRAFANPPCAVSLTLTVVSTSQPMSASPDRQVELIGDCYFAATGGPAGDGAQADIAARLGVAMISAVRDVAEAYDVDLQVQ